MQRGEDSIHAKYGGTGKLGRSVESGEANELQNGEVELVEGNCAVFVDIDTIEDLEEELVRH